MYHLGTAGRVVKVGDLVKIQKWCKNKHRMAIVVRTNEWDKAGVWIKYVDGMPDDDDNRPAWKQGYAMRQNLILMSKS